MSNLVEETKLKKERKCIYLECVIHIVLYENVIIWFEFIYFFAFVIHIRST